MLPVFFNQNDKKTSVKKCINPKSELESNTYFSTHWKSPVFSYFLQFSC